MKICFRANLYYNVGVAETVYRLNLAAKSKGIDFRVAGFIEDKISKTIPTIGPALPIDINEVNKNGEDYHIDEKNSSDVDLFIFYFDSQNPFIGERGKSELEKIVRHVPRKKSLIIDADGKSNCLTKVEGDSSHINEREREEWLKVYDAISDRVFQPSLTPLNKNVKSFMFWGYDEPKDKEQNLYDVIYLGSNWYRWDRMEEFMNNFKSLRHLFPRLAVVGSHWLTSDPYNPQANKHKPQFFEENNISIKEYVTKFGEFTRIIGQARFSPILVRPILSKMKLITPRMLETFASGTIPIIPNHFDYAEELYGKQATELMLGDNPIDKLKHMAKNEKRYQIIAGTIRDRLRKYSYGLRIEELISLIKD